MSKSNIHSNRFDFYKTKSKVTTFVSLLFDFRGQYQDLNLLKNGLHYYNPEFLNNRLQQAKTDNQIFLNGNFNKKWIIDGFDIDLSGVDIKIEKNLLGLKDNLINISLFLKAQPSVLIRLTLFEKDNRSFDNYSTKVMISDIPKQVFLALKPKNLKAGVFVLEIHRENNYYENGLRFEYDPFWKKGKFYPYNS